MTCIAFIHGDTFRFRAEIGAARDRLTRTKAYAWDTTRKAWMRKYETDVTVERALGDIRAISGIGNRGNFAVEVQAMAGDAS